MGQRLQRLSKSAQGLPGQQHPPHNRLNHSSRLPTRPLLESVGHDGLGLAGWAQICSSFRTGCSKSQLAELPGSAAQRPPKRNFPILGVQGLGEGLDSIRLLFLIMPFPQSGLGASVTVGWATQVCRAVGR